MTKNMGTTDRLVRILVALGIAVLYFAGTISGITAIVLGVIAVVFAVTAIAGVCPGYVPLGISTRSQKSESARV